MNQFKIYVGCETCGAEDAWYATDWSTRVTEILETVSDWIDTHECES